MTKLASALILAMFVAVPSTVAQTSQPARPRLAVVDFTVKGDVGIAGAGEVVAELLLTRLGQERYQLVERSQLAAILKEIDLTIEHVRDNPEKVYGRLRGVKYMVLGSVNKLGNIVITARLVDIASGDIVQRGEVEAEDARGVQTALSDLAKVLAMTDEEKTAFLASKGGASPRASASPSPAGVTADIPLDKLPPLMVAIKVLQEEIKATDEQMNKLPKLLVDQADLVAVFRSERDLLRAKIENAAKAGDKQAAVAAESDLAAIEQKQNKILADVAANVAKALTGDQPKAFVSVWLYAQAVSPYYTKLTAAQKSAARKYAADISAKLRPVQTWRDAQDWQTLIDETRRQSGIAK